MLDWIDEHGEDADIDEPLEEGTADAEDEAEQVTGAQCLVCNDCLKKFTSVAFAQLHASKTGHEDFSESTEAVPTLTEGEKKERLAELRQKLVEKRKLDELARKDEEKANELIRRKATKDTAEIKRELEEKEAKKALEQRMRDKEEEKQQRARIKAQIEDDRKRMREKAEAEKRRAQGEPAAQMPASAPLVSEQANMTSDLVRLQIRLPDGKALRETVPSSMTLLELLGLVDEKCEFTSDTHSLMIALPPRSFDADEEGSKTLQDLGLCPSATLVLRKTPQK